MDTHRRLSGALVLAHGLVGLLLSMRLLLGVVQMFSSTGDGFHLGHLLAGLALLPLLWSLLAVWGGVAALNGRLSARLPLIWASVPLLLFFPIGTAAAAYALWAHLPPDPRAALPEWKRLAMRQAAL